MSEPVEPHAVPEGTPDIEPLLAQIAELQARLARNEKIKKTLMERVERSVETAGSAYTLFERNILLEQSVSQRTAELKESETAYKALYDQSHLNEQRLETLYRLNQMADEPLNVLCQFTMEEAVRLTGSTIGYLAFVSEDEKVLTMHAWSRSAMKECRIEDKPIIYPVEKTGLWGEAIRQRKPVITNDYSQPNPLKKGCPQGHVSVQRHMNAPIFDGDRIVIVAGVGNKPIDYDETDIRQLTLLMQGMWSIIQRKKAEESLRTSEERYRTIVEHINDALYIHDLNGILLDVNDNTCKLLGYSREELIGSHLSRFDSPDNARQVGERMSKLMESGILVFDGEHLRKDGSLVPTSVSASVVSREGSGIVQSFLRDITDRKRAEEAQRKAMEAANAANIAKSQFLANMSHEIRTPMNAILGFAELLAQDNLSPQQSDFVQTIRNSGSHLLELINDILDFSKIEAGKMTLEFTECSLEELLNELESLMAPFAQTKGLRFEMIEPTVLPQTIRTDPVRMRQCLTNLVNNAIKFTEAGHVIVRTTLTESAGKPFLRFEVEDTGPGIDPRVQGKIFEAFEQADGSMTRKFGGTGLGLTITRHLAELLGGSLTLTSQLGKGSTFVIEIPANTDIQNHPVQNRHNFPIPSEASESLPRQFQGRVLVAEDVKTNQVLIRILLNQVGLEPVIVEDGQAAVEQVLRHEFDLILLDMQMPRLNGFEAARKLRKQGIRTPIVALTAGAIKGDEQKCLEAGCDDYLTKPIDRKELLRVLGQYLKAAAGLQSPV